MKKLLNKGNSMDQYEISERFCELVIDGTNPYYFEYRNNEGVWIKYDDDEYEVLSIFHKRNTLYEEEFVLEYFPNLEKLYNKYFEKTFTLPLFSDFLSFPGISGINTTKFYAPKTFYPFFTNFLEEYKLNYFHDILLSFLVEVKGFYIGPISEFGSVNNVKLMKEYYKENRQLKELGKYLSDNELRYKLSVLDLYFKDGTRFVFKNQWVIGSIIADRYFNPDAQLKKYIHSKDTSFPDKKLYHHNLHTSYTRNIANCLFEFLMNETRLIPNNGVKISTEQLRFIDTFFELCHIPIFNKQKEEEDDHFERVKIIRNWLSFNNNPRY